MSLDAIVIARFLRFTFAARSVVGGFQKKRLQKVPFDNRTDARLRLALKRRAGRKLELGGIPVEAISVEPDRLHHHGDEHLGNRPIAVAAQMPVDLVFETELRVGDKLRDFLNFTYSPFRNVRPKKAHIYRWLGTYGLISSRIGGFSGSPV